MKLFVTDQKEIAESLAKAHKLSFNTKYGYFEKDNIIVLYIEPDYVIGFKGVGRKLIRFFDGMEEINVLVNYSNYRDIARLKKIIETFHPEIINACESSSKGQMNFEIIFKCAGLDTNELHRIWMQSNIIDEMALQHTKMNSKYYPMYEAILCDTIIDAYWLVRNVDIFGDAGAEYKVTLKEIFLLNMIAAKEAQILNDDTAGTEYFRVDVILKEKTFKWFNKKKEDRISTISEARDVMNSLKDGQVLITKVESRMVEKEHPLLYNTSDLYKDVQKNKLATIKELSVILEKLYTSGYITNPNTESRHLPLYFVNKENSDEIDKITEILIAIKAIPLYKPYIEYIKRSNEYIILSSRSLNDKHVDNHHAIIPTAHAPVVHNLTNKEYNVYDLIVRRFLTLFMGNLEENIVLVNGYIDANNYLKYEETKIIKAGWQLVYDTEGNIYDVLNVTDEEPIKLDFYVGEYIPISDGSTTIQTGNPRGKSRYTISSLIDIMSNCGKIIKDDNKRVRLRHISIGSPGERNLIIDNLLEKSMIEVIDGKVHITAKGKELIDKTPKGLLSLQLLETFNNKIKAIEQGHDTMFSVLREQTSYITKIILDKNSGIDPYKIVDYDSIVKNYKCPFCRGELRERETFIGCKNYPQCDMSIPKEKNQHVLTEKDIIQLFDEGITDLITDFTFRKGPVRGGRAKLKLNNQRKVEFVFEK